MTTNNYLLSAIMGRIEEARQMVLAGAATERVIAGRIIVAIPRIHAGLGPCVDIVLSIYSGTVPVSE
jgi:hypothetical protein